MCSPPTGPGHHWWGVLLQALLPRFGQEHPRQTQILGVLGQLVSFVT